MAATIGGTIKVNVTGGDLGVFTQVTLPTTIHI